MTDQLETQLREALAARAAELPRGSGARLRQLDYHPRTRSLRPPVAAGVVVAAGAAAATVALVGLDTGTQEAFAGWSPTPTQAQRGQLPAAETTCQNRLAAPMGTAPPGATKFLKHGPPPTITDPGTMTPVLTDTRGPFTFVILANDHGAQSCITGPSFTWMSGSATSGSTSVPAGKVALSSTHITPEDGHAFSFAEGHTASNVTGTRLALDDGRQIKATVENGWFVAWWPSSHSVKSVLVSTPSGTTTQDVNGSTRPACPKTPAAARAVVCASGTTLRSAGGVVSGSASGFGGAVSGATPTGNTVRLSGSSSGKIHSSK